MKKAPAPEPGGSVCCYWKLCQSSAATRLNGLAWSGFELEVIVVRHGDRVLLPRRGRRAKHQLDGQIPLALARSPGHSKSGSTSSHGDTQARCVVSTAHAGCSWGTAHLVRALDQKVVQDELGLHRARRTAFRAALARQ